MSSAPRVAFMTLGCKVNQSETDLYARQFAAAGYDCVPFDQAADVYVVNTCTVTHVSDKKSRQMLGQARRANPEALVVATGCYASIAGHALADDRTLVIRPRDKGRLLLLVEGRLRRTPPDVVSTIDLEKYLPVPGGQVRSRAMVKAQDGCDSHCAYCIIPRARGRSRSTPPNDILQRVQALVAEGHTELVITGVDLGSYGEDDRTLPDLGSLIEFILTRSEVQRLRISSLEPGDFKEEWLDLWTDPRLCRHLHIPLQAGSATVLERMQRRYTPAQYRSMVAACRRAIAGISITTDVIVGFPGESELEFEDGLHLVRELRFDGMHVFKYSPRSGTPAARLVDQVPDPVKAERSRLMRAEAVAGVERLQDRHRGTTASVAWESEQDGVWRGLSDTNVRAYGPSELVQPGRPARVRLEGSYRDGLWAEPERVQIPLVAVS